MTRLPSVPTREQIGDEAGAIDRNSVQWKILNDPMWQAVYALCRQELTAEHEASARDAERTLQRVVFNAIEETLGVVDDYTRRRIPREAQEIDYAGILARAATREEGTPR